jgi:hypothetical protein
MIRAVSRARDAGGGEGERKIDDTWHVLEMILGLLRHAETKAIAVLATAGVLGQMLLSLARSTSSRAGAAEWTGLGLSAAAVGGAAICASCALRPRLRARRGTTNPLYFGHIRADFGFSRESYIRALATLTNDPEAMTTELASQVWENAAIVRRKFMFANLAIWFLLFAILDSAGTVALALV